MVEQVKPIYEHHCSTCIFLGLFNSSVDLYYCPHDQVLIARHGKFTIEGAPFHMKQTLPGLIEAKRLAIEVAKQFDKALTSVTK